MSTTRRQGPLHGLRGVLLGGIGPGPYAAMLLADLGAEIVRIERPVVAEPGHPLFPRLDVFARGQSRLDADLKTEAGQQLAWRCIENADFLIEGFRPGTLERLGFAPDTCLERNPRLVIARITGWGQSGPLAAAPGHDLNYIGLTGALAAMPRRGDAQSRAIPLNLIGDFAGGGMWACLGIQAALLERAQSGKGQVVDAAMIDGALSLMSMAYVLAASGSLSQPPGHNLIDGGAHLYNTYTCADGAEIAVGAIEAQFYEKLYDLIGREHPAPSTRFAPDTWPALTEELADRFGTRPRDEWCAAPDATQACVSPVLSIEEAPSHPHHLHRHSFIECDGVQVPAPGPRFSRTPVGIPDGYRLVADSSSKEMSDERN
ncbi:MAG: CoA transferase [Burkholderiales bacterium]|nr:CoA transferase [Burkholderiales bacterium]